MKKFPILSDLDIFAIRLGLFYNNKEKIGSYLGIFLTIIYILSSLLLFIYYMIITLQRKNLQINDSKIYSNDTPYINLNNSELFYFAFGVENKSTSSRFIDETIYTAKAIYFYYTKNTEGDFTIQEERELNIEKCKIEKFGKNYQHLLVGEFNNSYCIDNFDIALIGGYIYSKFSYIRIKIYPCLNTTENNNHCKPQELIDTALAGGYFSILLEDIGLNPSNYTFPISPMIHDFYTTISKNFFRDIIFFYEMTEVETDIGLLAEKKDSIKSLKLDKVKETFYYTDEKNYYNGGIICKIDIRLSENIHVQKRIYSKISNVFSITGGYMQILYALFSLLILIPNKFGLEKIIVNNLINLDLKFERKNNSGFTGRRNSTIFLDTSKKDFTITINKSNNMSVNKQKRNSVNVGNMFLYGKKGTNKSPICFDHLGNLSLMDHSNNASRVEMNPKQSEYSYMRSQMGAQSVNRSINKSINRSINKSINNNLYRNYSLEFFEKIKNKGVKSITINIFEYFCCGKRFKKRKDIDLFKKGTSIYKDRMDFINLFRDLLIYEKCLKENYNFEKAPSANEEEKEEKIISNKIMNKLI